jgi:hypothetical protein
VNCDRSETQCVGIPELFGLLLLEHTRSLEVHVAYRVRAFSEPRNGRMADVVASTNLCNGLASLSPRDGLLPLMQSEFELPTKSDPSRLSPFAAFVSTGLNQLPLELGKAAQDGQHQPAVRGCRVALLIRERPEARASLGDRVQHVQEVPS